MMDDLQIMKEKVIWKTFSNLLKTYVFIICDSGKFLKIKRWVKPEVLWLTDSHSLLNIALMASSFTSKAICI